MGRANSKSRKKKGHKTVDHNPLAKVGSKPELTLSMLTDSGRDGQYVGFVQSPVSVPELLTTYVDQAPASGPTVSTPGGVVTQWQTWTDSGGDTALVAQWQGSSLMVFGGASSAELQQLAGSLTTRSRAS